MAEWDIHLEFNEGSSNKFWRGKVEGDELTTNWGRVGTDGQSKTKGYGSAGDASADLEKQAAKKRKKGYADIGDRPARAAAPEPPPPEPASWSASLVLKEEGRSIALALSVDGATIKTEVEETYASEDAARAAYARIKQQLEADGYGER